MLNLLVDVRMQNQQTQIIYISYLCAIFIVTPKYFDKFLIFIIFSTGWNPWGDWTSCSSSCGGGKQERRRTCNSKPGHMHHHTSTSKPCPSYNIEQRSCNSFDCKGKNLYPYYNCNKSCQFNVYCTENDTILV